MSGASEKSEQLGMSYGKAMNILRKSLLFSLVKKCNLDTCYRCGEKIEDIEDFSIEHKEPWLYSDNPKELYFNLGNIAYSHNSCNSKSRRARISKVTSSSGFLGVSEARDRKRKKAWYSRAYVDGKKVHLGRFLTPEEAAKAYDDYIVQYVPDAPTNKSLGLI